MSKNPDNTADRNVSPYTLRQKLARVAWAAVQCTVFGLSPKPLYGWRAMLLRSFGAKLGRNVRLRPSVKIEIPWNLTLGDDVTIGDYVILYALGPITIGARSFVSQYSHLCAGTHDHTKTSYPLQRVPITIGSDCWVAAEVFVAPGAEIGDGTVVGARSSVFGKVPGWVVAVGYPARAVKAREFDAKPGDV